VVCLTNRQKRALTAVAEVRRAPGLNAETAAFQTAKPGVSADESNKQPDIDTPKVTREGGGANRRPQPEPGRVTFRSKAATFPSGPASLNTAINNVSVR